MPSDLFKEIEGDSGNLKIIKIQVNHIKYEETL